jgi:hypothetical protein
MKTRAKTFDCVEEKKRVQKLLLEEYAARKSEFSSYADFIVKTAEESEEIRAWRERIAGAKTGVTPGK